MLGEPANRWVLWGAFDPDALRGLPFGPLAVYCRPEPRATTVRVYVPVGWINVLHAVHHELRIAAAVTPGGWPPTPLGALRCAAALGLTLAAVRLVDEATGGLGDLVRSTPHPRYPR